MAVQTTYNETLDAGRAGALVNTGEKVLVSKNVEDEALPFGRPVTQGTADNGVHLTTTGDTSVLGISVRDRSATTDQFAVNDSARVMLKGVIWVSPVVTVAAGDPVHVVAADGTFTNTGGITVSGASYESSGASGALVKVRLG